MIRKRWIAAATGLLMGAASADSPRHWLDRLGEAYQSLNYAGTFVYRHNGGVETLSVVHSTDNGRVQQRLQALSGVPREILRDGDSVACILPDSNKVVVGEGANKVSVADRYQNLDVAALSDFYKITLDETIRIADRMCRLLRIMPRDQLRYGYSLCLDEEQGMLLRSQVINEQGDVVEEMIFTEISFPRMIDGSALAASVVLDQFELINQTAESSDSERVQSHWEIESIPSGFKSHSVHQRHGLEHRVLSDGLATISVFIEALTEGEDPVLGPAEVGAVKTFTAKVGDHRATVVGEVPSETVRRVAENIRKVSK